MPRVARLNPGDAAHWRSIFAHRPARASTRWAGFRKASVRRACLIRPSSVTLPYVTLGEEDTVTFEAEAAAQGFEDINATATLRILQKTMRKEETALLGGNTSLALGKPGTPTLSASGTGGTLPAATYSVIVVALTFEGYRNSTPCRRRRDHNDHHRQRRQHLYVERRLLAAQHQRDAGRAAGQTLFATRPDRQRRRRLCLVCGRCRLGDAAGDHHDQQRRF